MPGNAIGNRADEQKKTNPFEISCRQHVATRAARRHHFPWLEGFLRFIAALVPERHHRVTESQRILNFHV
jgi:hypothetical protein